MTRILLFCIGMGLFFSHSNLLAQQRSSTEKQEAMEELRTEIKSFVRAEILPQMTRWKEKLDAALSPEDLKTLNNLRKRATELRHNRKSSTSAMRDAWKNEDYAALKRSRDNLKDMKEQYKDLLADLKPIGVTYKHILKDIGESAKTVVSGWRTRGKEIFASWKQRHEGELAGTADAIAARRGIFKAALQERLGKDGMKKLNAARFMLWDGRDLTDELFPR